MHESLPLAGPDIEPVTVPQSWLSHLPPLPTAAEMRQWDAQSLALGIPEMVLMENAAQAALTVLQKEVGSLTEKRILILMGGGNNGGDAACLARRLLGQNALPLVLHTRPLRAYTGVTGSHVQIARTCGVPFMALGADAARTFATLAQHPRWGAWGHAHVVVDGLLGTGFTGPVRPALAALMEAVNHRTIHDIRPFVLALDIPSGLDADSGAPSPLAIRANATVTFQAAKPGLHMPAGHPYTGRVHTMDIGIPPCVQEAASPVFRLLEVRHGHSSSYMEALAPIPASQSYKNSFGHVLILGGSTGLAGAAHLAARGALRAGAGLVSVAAPAAACMDIRAGLPDIMILPLHLPTGKAGNAGNAGNTTATDALWPASLPPPLVNLMARCTALVIGCGMGRTPSTAAFLRAILTYPQRPPAIIDADALYSLPLHALTVHDVLTPHPGEAAALLRSNSAAIQSDRVAAMRALCALSPATWVLKGANTLIGQQGHSILISPYVVSNLAVGGTGDVLSGCAGALMARKKKGHTGLEIAALAVILLAEAGLRLAGDYPLRGNLASQVADALPEALATLAARAL